MGTTADKLTYLNNTKNFLKDRLNSLGATITSSTTFRNYLTWLDTFYNNVSNKTDISVNGIKGYIEQETTTGANILPQDRYITSQTVNGITYTNNGDGTFNLKGTATANTSLRIIDTGIFNLNVNQEYYLYCSENYNSSSFNMSIITSENGSNKYFIVNSSYTPQVAPTNSRLQFYIAKNNYVDVQNVKIMLIEGSVPPVNYEKYTGGQPAPSTSYPQPITTLTGNVVYTITGDNTKTFTIPLGDIELCEINTYKDSIYSNDSKFYLKKEIAKINSYNGETITTDYESTTGGLDTEATVYYGTTASTTEITSSNYPELYAALKEIEDYLVSYKINKEFILGYSSPTIEY